MKPVILAPLVALALAAGGAGGYFWLSSGGGVEEAVVAQLTPTPEPSPTAAAIPTATPAPTAEPTVTIPADWQTYVDPKGRFSIRVPPEWAEEKDKTSEALSWSKITTFDEKDYLNPATNDWVELEIAVVPKEPGDRLENKAPAEGLQPRLSLDRVTLGGLPAIRQTRGFDSSAPVIVGYIAETSDAFIGINLNVVGPKSREYIDLFDGFIIKSFQP